MAGMSKRHFEALARIIKEAYGEGPETESPQRIGAVEEIARGIADMCRHENPMFDRGRFLKACGLEG